MKLVRDVQILPYNTGIVHILYYGMTHTYRVDVEKAMNRFPDKTVEKAVWKVAKEIFTTENAFHGYE